MARRFLEEFGIDPMALRESLSDLLIQAEEAKKRLSSAQTTRFSIQQGTFQGRYELDRHTFAELTADLMERTLSLTRKVLDDHRLDACQLDGVLLVGGSTRMPMVQDLIIQNFGRPPLSGVNVDEAVALGAALLAAEHSMPTMALAGRKTTVDVTNHSLGMIALNEQRTAYINSIILTKNKPIPCVENRPYQYRTGRAGTPMEVFMTQGESENPADVTYLGRYLVHDVPKQRSGLAILDIEYSYDVNGTVAVSAQLRGQGTPLRVTVEPLPPDVPERFLKPPVDVSVPEHVTVYLAFDLSGSMAGEPLKKAKQAAHGFLENIDLTHVSLGLMAFSDKVKTTLIACQDAKQIENAIEHLTAGETGWANSAHPFDELLHIMCNIQGRHWGIILTDGIWSMQPTAIQQAKVCRENGVDIIAIGFGSADKAFLQAIASSDEAGLFTDLGGLVDTFCSIAQVLTDTGGDFALASKIAHTKAY